MRVFLVDDEHLAIKQLEIMLDKMTGVHVVGKYTDPVKAISEGKSLKPDVAFLDIEMTEMNGIQVAEQLMDICPDIEVVFITAYDEYAVQAFELNAIDYVLKPVIFNRLKKAVERVRKRLMLAQKEEVQSSDVFRICCFPSLRIECSNKLPEPLKWRTAKAQELFSYLLYNRGQVVRKSTLIEVLWPGWDEDRGTKLLYTTIYQTKQSLKRTGMKISIHRHGIEGGYWMQLDSVTVDVDEWENGLKQAWPMNQQNIAIHEHLLAMYRGDFLGDHDYWWAESERQRLQQLAFKQMKHMADYYIQEQMPEEAIRIHKRILQLDPLQEASYFALMMLHAQLENREDVKKHYEQLCTILQQELAVTPREDITEWYKQWEKVN